jgi:hypothetical protein
MPEPWWYLKRRRNPSGVLGRPRSPVPLAERRKLARQKYRAKLAARGVRVVRLSMTTADADQLRTRAQAHDLSPGAFVGKLLHAQREA